MVIFDHVVCDLCEVDMGQLHHAPVDSGALVDMRTTPHFAVCPDCLEAARAEGVAA